MEYNDVLNLLKNRVGKVYDCTNLLRVSETYNGVWLEHVYDSLCFGYITKDFTVAKSTILSFIKYQNEYGCYPYSIKDDGPHYYQIQECVSFIYLAYLLYKEINDKTYLETVYNSGKKYIDFIYKYRMTRGIELVEAFVGFDTGHDNSARLDNFIYKGNDRTKDTRVKSNAIFALDMSCILYNNLTTLAKISKILNKKEEDIYLSKASVVKNNIFKYLYDKDTNYFYDLDELNTFIKVKSSSLFHLFQEHVLDERNDKEMIDNLIINYLLNKNEFNTLCPIPSVSISDKSIKSHKILNSWGYYAQSLTVLRFSLWYKEYHLENHYKKVIDSYLYYLKENLDKYPFPQEFDPLTGIANSSSLYYSSSIIIYLMNTK